MKTQKQNIIIDSINYLKNFLPLNKEFDTYKHIGQAISDSLKVSYISAGKIKGIKENTGVIIGKRPTDEQRNKYFTATTIEKLLKKLFIVNTSDESKKFYSIINDIDDYLKQNIKYDFFIDSDVSGFYSNEPEDYNGSCMAGKPKEFFELYDHINKIDNNTTVKVVGFKNNLKPFNNTIFARGLLWCKTYNKNTLCEKTGKIIDTKTTKKYFLDRIYINNKLQNSCFEKLQFELFQTIRRIYKIDLLDVFNATHIKNHIKSKYENNTDKLIFKTGRTYPSFAFNVDGLGSLSRFPYMDTFRFVDDYDTLSIDDADAIMILDQTEGNYTESSGCCCDECGSRVDQDDQIYSELDGETLCHNCAVYIDERDEYVNENNAIYNDYSGQHHYRDDLNI